MIAIATIVTLTACGGYETSTDKHTVKDSLPNYNRKAFHWRDSFNAFWRDSFGLLIIPDTLVYHTDEIDVGSISDYRRAIWKLRLAKPANRTKMKSMGKYLFAEVMARPDMANMGKTEVTIWVYESKRKDGDWTMQVTKPLDSELSQITFDNPNLRLQY